MTAAATLFAEQGYGATTIRDIGRETGVTPGAIYAHFSSKQALLLDVYRLGVATISDTVSAAIDARSDPWERLRAAIAAHLECLLDASPFAAVIVRVLPADAPEISDQLVALRDRYEETFKGLFDELGPAADSNLPLQRLLLLGALNAVPNWYAPGSDTPDEIAAVLCATLRHGIAGEVAT